MKRPALLAATVCLIAAACAQTDAELEAPVLAKELFFGFAKDPDGKPVFGYRTDEDGASVTHSRSDTLLLVKERKFVLNMIALNPLRFSVTVSGKTVAQPADEGDLSELTGLLSGFFGLTPATPGTLVNENRAANGVIVDTQPAGYVSRSSGAGSTVEVHLARLPLNETEVKVQQRVAKLNDPALRSRLLSVAASDNIHCFVHFRDELGEVAEVDNIFKKINDGGAAKVKALLEALWTLEPTAAGAPTKLAEARKMHAELEKDANDLQAAITKAKTTRTSVDKDSCALAQEALVRTAIDEFLFSVQTALEKYRAIHTALDGLVTKVEGVVDAVAGGGAAYITQLYSGDIPKGKAHQVRLLIEERTKPKVQDDGTVTYDKRTAYDQTILFRFYRPVVPQVMPALVGANFRLTTYDYTEDSLGIGHVAENTTQEPWANLALMANFNFNLGSSPLVPFTQIGASLVKKRLQLFFPSVGLRFTPNISASIGLMHTLRPELDELSIGDTVSDQKTIDDDLTYRAWEKMQLFFSIQLRP